VPRPSVGFVELRVLGAAEVERLRYALQEQ
jgi:hypothetical protein